MKISCNLFSFNIFPSTTLFIIKFLKIGTKYHIVLNRDVFQPAPYSWKLGCLKNFYIINNTISVPSVSMSTSVSLYLSPL